MSDDAGRGPHDDDEAESVSEEPTADLESGVPVVGEPDDEPELEPEPDEEPELEPEPDEEPEPDDELEPDEEPASEPESEQLALPLGTPAIPRRTMATSSALESDTKRLNLDWLVPTITIVVVVVLLWLTILWTMNGGNFFGFPSLPERTDAPSPSMTSATPTPSPTPTPTEAPAPDPSVAAPTFINFGAPTSVSCVAPSGGEEVAAVAFSLSWGSLDAESATVSVDGGPPAQADATGAFAATFPCPAATATYVVTLDGRGGATSRTVTIANVGYTG